LLESRVVLSQIDHFAVMAPPQATAGDVLSVTVIAEDASDQPVTDYAGTVHFGSGDAQASLPGDYTFVPDDQGAHAFDVSLRTAGPQDVTATDASDPSITGSATVLVHAAALDHFQVDAPGCAVAGVPFHFVLTAEDAYGNPITDYTGTAHFSSGDTQATLPHDFTFTTSDRGQHTFAATLRTAGPQDITVNDAEDTDVTGTATVCVHAAALDHFDVDAPASAVAGVPFHFVVTAEDAYGNPITDYTGTATFSSADGQATLPHDFTFTTSDQGQHTFAATLRTAGPQDITVTDANDPSVMGSATVIVGAAALDHFDVDAPASTVAGETFQVTVTAEDAYGNTVPDYAGTVHFTSSDAQAGLPEDYTFVADDHGAHAFDVSLRTAGPQDVTVTDTADASITGTATVIVSAAAMKHFEVSAPDTAVPGVPFHFVVTAEDAFGNPITDYIGTAHFSSADGQATLPHDFTFTTSDQGQHTFAATLRTTGPQDVTVTDANDPDFTGTATVDVVPPPVGAPTAPGASAPAPATPAGIVHGRGKQPTKGLHAPGGGGQHRPPHRPGRGHHLPRG
jgi:FKBP-type peptidyl-prolyl cis-trans isomerase 2